MAKTQKPERVEECFAQLEDILAKLEDGSIPLDQAIVRYEEGLHLVTKVREQLDAYQQRIEVLRSAEGATTKESETDGPA